MRKRASKKPKVSRARLILRLAVVFTAFIVIILLLSYGLFLYYRPEIKKAINNKLSEEINGEIDIGTVGIELFRDFPTLAFALEDVHLRGPEYRKFPHDFFAADRVEIQVDAEKLLDKELKVTAIRIFDANCFMFKSKSGYSNLDIFKKKKPDSVRRESPVVVSFRNIQVENMAVVFRDSTRNQSFDFQFIQTENHILKRDSSFVMHVAGDILFNGLTFNAERGTFLREKKTKGDFHLEFFQFKKELVIAPSTLEWKNAFFNLSGDFRFSDPKNFQLNIQTDAIAYKEGLSVLTEPIRNKMEKYNIGKPIKVDVNIVGRVGAGKKTAVDVRYHFINSDVTTDKFELRNASVQGSFTNHLNPALEFNDRNSRLVFDSLKASLDGIPFRAHAVVGNLANPDLNLNAIANFNLTEMNKDLDKDKVQFTSGHAEANILYSGNLKGFSRDAKTLMGKLAGTAKIKNGGVRFIEEQIVVDQAMASIRFTQDKFDIDQLVCRINQNAIEVKGSLVGFMPFIEAPEKKGKVVLSVNSPHLDLTRMLARKEKPKPNTKRQRKKQLMDTMSKVYEGLEIDFAFVVKEFVYNRFMGKNLKGNVALARNKLKASRMSVDFAAGRVLFNLDVDRVLSARSPFSIRASVLNSGLKEFFYAFNNFNQTAIKYQNLEGKLFMDATFQGVLNKELILVPSTLLGRTTFRLRNGKLVEFEPLMNMSNFLFKHRDFSDVNFAEIKGDLMVKGTEIDVSRMEVQSSVLTAFLEGRYSLKDSTDLSIQLPLSNLKKRDKKYKPKNVGADASVGPSVFLRARYENGKTEISYDPLKKFRRKKGK